MKLLDTLVADEKIINKKLYSSGPYWNYKNKRTLSELKKKGLTDFRGSSSGIGTLSVEMIATRIISEFLFHSSLVFTMIVIIIPPLHFLCSCEIMY